MSNSNSSAEDRGDNPTGRRVVNGKLALIVAICVALIGAWQQSQNKPQQLPPPNNPAERPIAEGSAESHDSVPRHHKHHPSAHNQNAPTPRIEPREPVASERPQTESSDPTKIPDVTLRDESGNIIFQGTVDLQPTLDRIEARERLPYSHDGSTFQNREGRLPRKPSGYYTEYVHLTPKHSGPGPQRIVIGKNGEVYYTHDHYRTFQRIQFK